jgi:class 3 adenylate cyclase/pimeloyl-ACP methyl ester carboxylesterase
MEPRIQYAQTKDGVSIAFYSLGEGQPLVYMTSWPYQHLQLEWQYPFLAHAYEFILEKRRLIRFDGRGSGLSERSVSDYSLGARLLDLESVVEKLGLETFDLLGHATSGPLAIAFAARNPDRLSHLVLLNTYARAADYISIPKISGVRGLLDTDWETFTETVAHVIHGWSEGEEARRYAAYMRECTSQENVRASMPAWLEVDVTELLPGVYTPTLVVQYRGVAIPTVDITRGLASRISNARLVVLEGDYRSPAQAMFGPILEFLSEGEETPAGAEGLAAEDVHTILITDMEGSTTLTQRLGDAKVQDVLRTHNAILREALKAHSGSEIKHTGDGIMASFASASRALESAIAMQCAFAQHNESAPEPILVHVALNAGEPVAEEEDLFGTAVQLAARICAHAEPGQILVPIVVRELAAGKKFLFADLGETLLRGFEDPVRLFELRWQEQD